MTARALLPARLLPCLAIVGASITAVPFAFAQSQPMLRLAAQPADVETGQVFVVQLVALVQGTNKSPDQPHLHLPPGFLLRAGPQIMPQTQVSITGAGVQQSIGIQVNWQIEARAVGAQAVGPATVMWDGKRFDAGRVQVTVHPTGTLPRRQDPFDLFDLFGMPKMPAMPQLPGAWNPSGDPGLPTPEPAMAVTAPSDRAVFLRAVADKSDVVLGEQLTLSVYEYIAAGMPKQVEAREPATSDFLQRQLLAPDEDPPLRSAEVGNETWRTRLIRKVALIPLRIGTLSIGPMEVKYVGNGFRTVTNRRSNPLQVTVRNAPEQGRPISFRAGDVGSFFLTADVAPRTVDQGGSVAVTAKLEGIGNLPRTLDVPRRKGLDWLDPTTAEQLDVNGTDRLRGVRTFTYVVRLNDAGTIDLGELELNYYDPAHRRYERTAAALGKVVVKASATAASAAAPTELDRFASIAPARTQLGTPAASSAPITDHPAYWAALAAGPVSVLFAGAAASLSRRARQRFASWRSSLARHAAISLNEARAAHRNGAAGDAAAAAERALHASIESATGLRSRGVLREALMQELTTRGLPQALADRCVDLLAECELLRFDPSASITTVDSLLDGIEALNRDLTRIANRLKATS